jgi:APA family basic amino acid/polyamine antiporter
MCYAEFATAIPVAGSAYVFTYATMGEILAWIIGWNLILELFTAAAVIAKYWGIYLSKVFALMGVEMPPAISVGGLTCTGAPSSSSRSSPCCWCLEPSCPPAWATSSR